MYATCTDNVQTHHERGHNEAPGHCVVSTLTFHVTIGEVRRGLRLIEGNTMLHVLWWVKPVVQHYVTRIVVGKTSCATLCYTYCGGENQLCNTMLHVLWWVKPVVQHYVTRIVVGKTSCATLCYTYCGG